MDKQFWMGLVILSLGALHFIALHKEWGWFMNSWQNAPMREEFGEHFFVVKTYVGGAAFIVIGFLFMFNIPVGKFTF